MNSHVYKEYNLLGIKANAFTIEKLNELIQSKIANSSKAIVAHHNMHSVYLFNKNPEFREFFDFSQYAHFDGMTLVTWGRLMGYDLQKQNRITYLDWIPSLLALINNNSYKVFYLGSKEGVGERALRNIRQVYPNVQFEIANGYFDVNDVDQNNNIISRINNFEPDILMVGMGMPRQEIWIKNNYHLLDTTIILPCGACFDYLAGEVNTPPRWMGQYNLEWFHRFLFEPKRLFIRYFIEPVNLFPVLVKDLKTRWNS
jgi:N-acetylglucosaminyldiphosphoundecaprenol N-acetyl-beta-D-mannosaminyltransferase